jgi:hypothetical protein
MAKAEREEALPSGKQRLTEKAKARQIAKQPWRPREAANRTPITDMLWPRLMAEDRARAQATVAVKAKATVAVRAEAKVVGTAEATVAGMAGVMPAVTAAVTEPPSSSPIKSTFPGRLES